MPKRHGRKRHGAGQSRGMSFGAIERIGTSKPKLFIHWERITDGHVPTEYEIRSCLRKKRYSTVAFAKKVAIKEVIAHRVRNYCYHCKFCDGYHLTHKKEPVVDDGKNRVSDFEF